MKTSKAILLSILLSIPVILFLLHHFYYHLPYLHPTGFTVNENVLYMSYARQYIDNQEFSLFYSNPFDGNPASPTIYFQPVNFLFLAALKAGIAPGICFSLFGLLMAVACIFTGIKIIQHLLPDNKQQSLIILLFTWGGGLIAVSGLIGAIVLPDKDYDSFWNSILLADPANGWWGLNWGRNLFIPLEAYYHFLFLLNICLILQKKWRLSLATALFLSVSHPFTGIELLLILNGWLFIEIVVKKNKAVPYWYFAGIFIITLFHLWYYMIYLNRFPEHRQLFSQYSAGWTYSLLIAIPAYSLVAALSILSACKKETGKNFLGTQYQRLFLCWAIISFLLSKHEWFIKPMQPIHFTRGYTWAGLFLLSLPGLKWLLDYLQAKSIRKWLLAGLIVLFLTDNTLWTINLLRNKETTEWEGHITAETNDILSYLKTNGSPQDLLLGNAPLVNYIANAYTPVNSWISHPYNTPSPERRKAELSTFFLTGTKSSEWKERRLLILLNKKAVRPFIQPNLLSRKLYENNSYILFTP